MMKILQTSNNDETWINDGVKMSYHVKCSVILSFGSVNIDRTYNYSECLYIANVHHCTL